METTLAFSNLINSAAAAQGLSSRNLHSRRSVVPQKVKAVNSGRVTNCVTASVSNRDEKVSMVLKAAKLAGVAGVGLAGLAAAPLTAHASPIVDGLVDGSLDPNVILPAMGAAFGGIAVSAVNKLQDTIQGTGADKGKAPVTEEEVLAVQAAWAGAIQNISKVHKEGGDYVGAAGKAAGELYGYGSGNVLFKPTKAQGDSTFRPTAENAMSYFVGGNAVDGGLPEDSGFAINGGKGWAKCVYDNHQIELKDGIGIAMGTYDFTCATTGEVSTVEYTFGYSRCDDGKVRIFLHHSSVPYTVAPPPPAAPVTEKEVLTVQANWAAAIQNISKVYAVNGDYVAAAAEAAGQLYAYGDEGSNVLFKPTKATGDSTFRPTPESAMSYFVGGDAVDGGFTEDSGFAINGGKGWAKCVYDNHQVELHNGMATAMGTYDFTCATTGEVSTVEYTFGYKRCEDGEVRIFLHHSSVPYNAAPLVKGAPVSEAEVLAVQEAWAGAIQNISKVHKEGGDYIGAAGEAAGELYAYGHTNVLFKPTKAMGEYTFRPTAEDAMSYFVGGNAVDGGYEQDGGFAINGGKGWRSCVYNNHQIELHDGIATAMGTYDFTCDTTGEVSTVEYTFGYSRCKDDKVRIFLHHSSVPYAAAPVKEAEKAVAA